MSHTAANPHFEDNGEGGGEESEHPAPALVAFASWRCNCTMLALTFGEIPARCPEHEKELLAAPSWEDNAQNVPLGRRPTWAVKCDDCKTTIRRTEDVRECSSARPPRAVGLDRRLQRPGETRGVAAGDPA